MRTLTFNRIIGSGAMGTVYHAELRAPGGFARTCAVKVMKSTSPDQEHFRARMRDEARLLGMLQDEQVLGVSELVRVSGRDVVVMEYVDGVDLADLIKARTLPPKALAELGAEVAGTLHRAHMARHPHTGEYLHVIHRDVKPANVMVTSRGGVRLLDFGVARAAFSSRESHTQGLVLGTLNYFPPEILAGGDPTSAVDLYGLGLTLWECATGKDWGSPQVHRNRFERRVDQRLAEIDELYRPLIPVMKQVLQWDPSLRPDGGVVERALLHAASTADGEGLRTWAREVVPGLLESRHTSAKRDDLVGKTFSIEGAEVAPPAPAPLQVMKVAPVAGSPMEDLTFNDLAPPAAVKRGKDNGALSDPEEARTLPLPPAPVAGASPASKKPKASSGPGYGRVLLVLLAGLVVGGGAGAIAILAIAAALYVAGAF